MLRLFFPKPSLAPIFFQPLVCMAFEIPLGEVPKLQSELGGVVGGVIGSLPEGYPELLSSVKPSMGESATVDEEAERLVVSLCHPNVCRGRRPLAFEDRLE